MGEAGDQQFFKLLESHRLRTFVAVLAVVAAFFSGLALGAYVLDRPISRSQIPGRWYAALELAIGAWSLALSERHDANGLASARGPGTTTITATISGVQGTAQLDVIAY